MGEHYMLRYVWVIKIVSIFSKSIFFCLALPSITENFPGFCSLSVPLNSGGTQIYLHDCQCCLVASGSWESVRPRLRTNRVINRILSFQMLPSQLLVRCHARRASEKRLGNYARALFHILRCILSWISFEVVNCSGFENSGTVKQKFQRTFIDTLSGS